MRILTSLALAAALSASANQSPAPLTVLEDLTEVVGDREAAAIHATVSQHATWLAGCRDVATHARDGSRVSVGFELSATGRPTAVAVEGGTVTSREIRSCIEERLRTLAFGDGTEAFVRVDLQLRP